jgi:hypothetical protein
MSTASIIVGRRRSIIGEDNGQLLPRIMEAPLEAERKVKAGQNNLLSRSVLLDKSNLEKLKRYQAELS